MCFFVDVQHRMINQPRQWVAETKVTRQWAHGTVLGESKCCTVILRQLIAFMNVRDARFNLINRVVSLNQSNAPCISSGVLQHTTD